MLAKEPEPSRSPRPPRTRRKDDACRRRSSRGRRRPRRPSAAACSAPRRTRSSRPSSPRRSRSQQQGEGRGRRDQQALQRRRPTAPRARATVRRRRTAADAPPASAAADRDARADRHRPGLLDQGPLRHDRRASSTREHDRAPRRSCRTRRTRCSSTAASRTAARSRSSSSPARRRPGRRHLRADAGGLPVPQAACRRDRVPHGHRHRRGDRRPVPARPGEDLQEGDEGEGRRRRRQALAAGQGRVLNAARARAPRLRRRNRYVFDAETGTLHRARHGRQDARAPPCNPLAAGADEARAAGPRARRRSFGHEAAS